MRTTFRMQVNLVAVILIISAVAGAPLVADGAEEAPLIPKSVNFTPHALKERIIYEHLVKTEVKVQSPIAGVIQSMIPEGLLDCSLVELKIDETKAEKAVDFQCQKLYVALQRQVPKDGKLVNQNIVFASGNDETVLPSCQLTIDTEGVLRPMGAKPGSVSTYTIITPGVTGTAQLGGGSAGQGMILIGQFGFAPLASTLGKPRAVNSAWTLKTRLGATDIPEEYTLKGIERLNGWVLATLENKPGEQTLDAGAVPKQRVNIGNTALTLEASSLTVDLKDEALVDVEKGVVVHQSRVMNAKVVYKLELPDTIPEFIRKMAGNELTLLGKFTINDTLLDEAQTNAFTAKETTPEAIKLIKDRWEKRAAGSDALIKDLATAILGTLDKKDETPKPNAGEF